MPRENINPFDALDEIRRKKNKNYQLSFEKKIAKKLIERIFGDDPEEKDRRHKELKYGEVEAPLAELNQYLHPFKVYAFNPPENTSILRLLKAPTNRPEWEAYKERLIEASKMWPDLFVAMIYRDKALEKDVVVHNHMNFPFPSGEFRLTRLSSNKEGGVVIDTFEGFITVLMQNW